MADSDSLEPSNAFFDAPLFKKVCVFSRNAVAGKAHRLALPKRNSPISSEGEERNTKEKTKSFNILKEVPLKISLRNVEWSRTKCCWPEGDPKLKGFKFCGEEILPGRPYCTKHSYIAYTNSREN